MLQFYCLKAHLIWHINEAREQSSRCCDTTKVNILEANAQHHPQVTFWECGLCVGSNWHIRWVMVLRTEHMRKACQSPQKVAEEHSETTATKINKVSMSPMNLHDIIKGMSHDVARSHITSYNMIPMTSNLLLRSEWLPQFALPITVHSICWVMNDSVWFAEPLALAKTSFSWISCRRHAEEKLHQ